MRSATKPFRNILAAIIVILAFSAIHAEAATFTVTNTNDTGAGSLRQAVTDSNAAAGSDTITFDPSVFSTPQTITLASAISVNPATGDSLTITGPGANLLTVSGNNNVAIFGIVAAGDTVFVSGMTLTGGSNNNGGSVFDNRGNLTVTNVAFNANFSNNGGGAIENNGGALTVSNSTFNANTANGAGGAISIAAGTATITNSTFTNHTVPNGGAISNNGTSLIVTGCTFSNNTATGTSATGLGGGAIYSSATGTTVTISNSTFTNNKETGGSGGGGAIRNRTGSMTVSGSTFTNNSAVAGGGAIQNSDVMNIGNSTVSGNSIAGTDGTSSNGGGISNTGVGQMTITDSLINGNSALRFGGGIYHQPNNSTGALLTVTNTTISNNLANSDVNANGDGGGLYLTGSGTVNINNSTVSGNRVKFNTATTNSGGDGGGIDNSTILNLTNCTISGNTAESRGGGIWAAGSSTQILTINSSTIVGNDAPSVGGGLIVSISTNPTRVGNTIIANNTSPFSPDVNGAVISQGYNLIENTSGATISGTTTGNITGVDPRIDEVLRDNGGATKTHALRLISPALDAGDPTNFPAVDQRGQARPADGNRDGAARADIGAVERQPGERTLPESFDFDGDGRADISVFRPMSEPASNFWYVLQSSNNTLSTAEWGIQSDRLVPADYDGDGKTDYAVYRGDGEWYISQSANSQLRAIRFGLAEDIPMPGDFDGDERADITVFRPSNGTWYRLNSLNEQFAAVQFGQSGDRPLIGDYDGDAKSDITVFRPSDGVWYRLNSANDQFVAAQFGVTGDIPVSGDFNGDGRSDLAVFRPSSGFWYVARPTGVPSQNFDAVQFGASGDTAVAADYDGDGKTDIAVYRGGNWLIRQSASGALLQTGFGIAADKPVPAAYQFLP